MDVTDLITPDRIRFRDQSSSKKRVLEQLSELLAADAGELTAGEIFEKLVERERLGSTGFGRGVAIPHCRIAGLRQPVAAFIRLDRGVDFDAMDGELVDLIFALVVPEESTEEHLNLLSQLAQVVTYRGVCESLRDANNPQEVHALLRHREPEQASA